MEMISTTGTAAVSPLFIIALAFGAGLGIALICFSFFNRKQIFILFCNFYYCEIADAGG